MSPTIAAIDWATAERYAPEVIRRLTALPWPRNTLINVNFPDVAPDRSPASPRPRRGGARSATI